MEQNTHLRSNYSIITLLQQEMIQQTLLHLYLAVVSIAVSLENTYFTKYISPQTEPSALCQKPHTE